LDSAIVTRNRAIWWRQEVSGLKVDGRNMMQSNVEGQSKQRLLSIDALRGMDMFWIIGGEGLFAALFTLTGLSQHC
jgi:hypothetical protein